MNKKEAVAQMTEPKVSNNPLDVLNEFNGRYMVVNESGKPTVFRKVYDEPLQRHIFQRITFEGLRQLYENRLVYALGGPGKDGSRKEKWMNAADFWLKNPYRKQYIDGVVFDPSKPANGNGEVLNLWQGFEIEPKQGDWTLLRDHIRDVLCSGDIEHFEYFIDLLAEMFQHPEKPWEVVVVLRSGQGAGKGILGRAIKRIFGQHGIRITQASHLIGRFNAHLADCVFLFPDEAIYAGNKEHASILKGLMMDPTFPVEAKYRNVIEAVNRLHILMASNSTWVVSAELDDRRFFIPVVSDARKGDHEYFKKIMDQLEDGGHAAMLYELLHRDISNFNHRKIPQTAALQEQKKLTLPTHTKWWQDCLERGFVLESEFGLGYFHDWHERVSTELLFKSYLRFARANGDRHPLSREAFGRKMAEMKAQPRRLLNAAISERLNAVIRHPRPAGYHVGPLALARRDFCEVTGLTVEWPDPLTDDEIEAFYSLMQYCAVWFELPTPANDDPACGLFTYEARP